MARSHVKELAREAFELNELVVDADGDLPFHHGQVRHEGAGTWPREWTTAQAAAGGEPGDASS